MKYLLDTHTFLWSIAESSKLPPNVREEMRKPHNEVFISAVNLWEISIKSRINKIDLGGIDVENLIDLAEKMGIQLISLSPEECASYGKLAEKTHLDPFDRMLIWQAITRNLTLISQDSQFSKFIKHGLKLYWK